MAQPKLALNFPFKELVRSDTAAREGIDNRPSVQIIINATIFATTIAQPLRDYINRDVKPGAPERGIIVLSWYRSPALNAAIPGASKTSEHMDGIAMDMRVRGMTNSELIRAIKASGVPVSQVINEFPTAANGGWVHCAGTLIGVRPEPTYLLAREGSSGKTEYYNA